MALDLLNVGDSRAVTKAKMDAAFAEVGLPASGDTTEATNTFNELVTDYLDDPLPGLTDGMSGSTARSRINAAITALNEGGGVPAWELARRTAPEVAVPTGGTIYVSGSGATNLPAGNDTTGDGSISAPYATLTKAQSVISSAGNVLVLCDGLFVESTSASGRMVLNKVFAAPVVFDSYFDPDNGQSDFIISNASGTAGVINVRGNTCSEYQFRRATLRATTDNCSLFQSNPSGASFIGTNIRFFDCIFEARTQNSTSLGAIDLRTDHGINGLSFVRCKWKRVAGTNTTYEPIIISTTSATQTVDNQPFKNIGFWDCETTDGQWNDFGTNAGVYGVETFTAVRNDFVTANHALLIGKDTSGDTTPKCTDVYIWNDDLDANGTNAHGIAIGSNVEDAIVKDLTIESSVQGAVTKGSTGALIKSVSVTLTPEAEIGSGLYAKASAGSKFHDSTVAGDGSSFDLYGFREDADGANKASGTELLRTTIDVSGPNAVALLWATATGSDGGATSDHNHYILRNGASLGSVRGQTVTTIEELRAAWASHGLPGDSPLNDANSTVTVVA